MLIQAIMPFHPQFASQAVAVGATTGTVQITPGTSVGAGCVRIVNSGPNLVFFTLGDSTVTTSATVGIAMLPNTAETFYLRPDQRYIALIGLAAGNTAYISFGWSA